MKKFEVFFSSLFIIGLIGVLSLYLLTNKPTENYFAASLISVIAMLPKIFLEIFNVSKNGRMMMLKITHDLSNLSRNYINGRIIANFFFLVFLRFLFFYITLLAACDWIFSSVAKSLFFPSGLIALALYFWGRSYDRKHNPEGESINVEEVHEKLDFIEMISLPAHEEKFVVKDKFRVSQVKFEGVPQIGYICPDFEAHFHNRIEEPQPKRFIYGYESKDDIEDLELVSIIRENNYSALLSDTWDLLVLWEQSSKRLLDDGSFNIFPVKDDIDLDWIILVTRIDDKWEISAYLEIGELKKGEHLYSKEKE